MSSFRERLLQKRLAHQAKELPAKRQILTKHVPEKVNLPPEQRRISHPLQEEPSALKEAKTKRDDPLQNFRDRLKKGQTPHIAFSRNKNDETSQLNENAASKKISSLRDRLRKNRQHEFKPHSKLQTLLNSHKTNVEKLTKETNMKPLKPIETSVTGHSGALEDPVPKSIASLRDRLRKDRNEEPSNTSEMKTSLKNEVSKPVETQSVLSSLKERLQKKKPMEPLLNLKDRMKSKRLLKPVEDPKKQSEKAPVVNVELSKLPKRVPASIPLPPKLAFNEEEDEKMDHVPDSKQITIIVDNVPLLIAFRDGMTVQDLKESLRSQPNIPTEFNLVRGNFPLSDITVIQDHAIPLRLIPAPAQHIDVKPDPNAEVVKETNFMTNLKEFYKCWWELSMCILQSFTFSWELPPLSFFLCCETRKHFELGQQIQRALDNGLDIPPLTEGQKMAQQGLLAKNPLLKYLSLQIELTSHVFGFDAEFSCQVTAWDLNALDTIESELYGSKLIVPGTKNHNQMLSFKQSYPSAWPLERIIDTRTIIFFPVLAGETLTAWGFLRPLDEGANLNIGDLKVQLFRPSPHLSTSSPIEHYMFQKFSGFQPFGSYLAISLKADLPPKENAENEEQIEKMQKLSAPRKPECGVLFESWIHYKRTEVPLEAFEA